MKYSPDETTPNWKYSITSLIYLVGISYMWSATFAAEVLLKSQALRVNIQADQIKTTTLVPPTATLEPGPILIQSWIEGFSDTNIRSVGKSAYSLAFFGPEQPQPSNPIRLDVSECNKLFFHFVRAQNRDDISYLEAFGGWNEYEERVIGLNSYYHQNSTTEERIAWKRAIIRDGPFLDGAPGLKLPIIFQGPSAERGTTTVKLKSPEIQMVRVGDHTVRLKVRDLEGKPVPNERVHLECLAYSNLDHTSSNWDFPAYFRQRLNHLISGAHGSQYQERFLSRNPTLNAEDYFGSVSNESVITDQQGEAEVDISWPLYRWRLSTWGYKITNGTDGRVRILACSDQGYLGLFTSESDDASIGSSISLNYSKENYSIGNIKFHIPRRTFQSYTLEGQVIDSIEGHALAGVEVQTIINEQPFQTVTDPEGHYQLEITFQNGQGKASDMTPVARVRLDPVGMVVECSKHQYKTLQKFIPTEGKTKFTIQGQVTGAKTGEPISNVYVSIDNTRTTTDDNGNYSLDIDGGGEIVILNFAFEEGTIGSVSASKNGIKTAGIQVEYSPDSLIQGHILFRGHPVNDATVSIRNNFEKANVSATSDENGFFSLVLGDGTQIVDAGVIRLGAYSGQALADVVTQKDRLSNRSNTALYKYYDVQAVDTFLDNYPERLASATQSEISIVEDSAVRLSNVLLHVYQLDNIGHDYAERILTTLGTVLSDLLEKTDMIAQLTELPGEGLSKDVADQLLEDVRESLNKLTRNFVSALGYTMSGNMPATMQANTRKFLISLKENGVDAFKTEMREALLAHALRVSAQSQINQAAHRCIEMDFKGDSTIQKNLAYQQLTRQFESLNAFIESENWQDLINTVFESVEEAAGYAKYVGSPLGWYKFIEIVENSSGILSKALAGAGAAHAMSAFSDLSIQIPLVVQLDLGDLDQLPSPKNTTPQLHDPDHGSLQARNFSPLLESEVTTLPETIELIQRLQQLRNHLEEANQSQILEQTEDYLISWHAYERRMDASIKLYAPDNLPENATPIIRDLRSQHIQIHQDTLYLAMRNSLQLLLMSQSFKDIDFSKWRDIVDSLIEQVILADKTLNLLAKTVTPLTNKASITGIEILDNSIKDDSLEIAVTISNPGQTSIKGLSIVETSNAYLDFQNDQANLPEILPGQSMSLNFTAMFNPKALLGHAVMEFKLKDDSMEHDSIQSTLPTSDAKAPTIKVIWPPQRQLIPALEDLIFKLEDNRPLNQLHIHYLVLNQETISTEGLSVGEDGILIIELPRSESPDFYSGQLRMSDAKGNESVASFEFTVGNSTYPMFAILDQSAQWFNPKQSSMTWDIWTGVPAGYQASLSFINAYHELPALAPDSMTGRTTITWDGFDSGGSVAPSGTYKLAMNTLSNFEILHSSVHLITDDSPITELRVIKSNLSQGGYLTFAVHSKNKGSVDCKYLGHKFETLSLDAGLNLAMCLPMDSLGKRISHLSVPVELEFTDSQHKKWSYFINAPPEPQTLPPEITKALVTVNDEPVTSDTPIPIGITLGFSVVTTSTKGTSAFLLIRDANGDLIHETDMTPMTNGTTFYAEWSTESIAPSPNYEWIVQLVDAFGQSAPFTPRYLNLSRDGTDGNPDADGDGMNDAWERLYGGDLIPLEDEDMDGANNYREFISGTDPTDPSSRLELNMQILDGNRIVMDWETQPGRIYRVWGRNLMDTNEPWILAYETEITSEDDRIIRLLIPQSSQSGYYLLEVLLRSQ